LVHRAKSSAERPPTEGGKRFSRSRDGSYHALLSPRNNHFGR
jgi:hypothetical protein